MLDENGYTPLAYDDALDIAQGTVRQYAGQNVDLSDGSFFGVWAQVYATMLVDLDQKEEAVYDSGLINFANGDGRSIFRTIGGKRNGSFKMSDIVWLRVINDF